ncbi:ESX-1 secretion-associated protein [Mycobacterium sp.]|uniref:ESX-1 secretion-associated protein n=1 Tax=Mycobacterium sp. TaxID=1785 RepID=UPI003C74324C
MADRIHVVPDNLRQAAGHHQETSEYLRTLPSSHQAIQESLDSLGPIFGELREAGRELLEQRRLCYEQQADSHSEIADNLTKSANMWEAQDAESAQEIKRISDGGR